MQRQHRHPRAVRKEHPPQMRYRGGAIDARLRYAMTPAFGETFGRAARKEGESLGRFACAGVLDNSVFEGESTRRRNLIEGRRDLWRRAAIFTKALVNRDIFELVPEDGERQRLEQFR